MRFSDLFDLKWGPSLLVKLALVPLILIVACQTIMLLICRLSAADMFLAFLFLTAVSPLAYLLYQSRRGRPRREARRGAERTPVLPSGHEEDHR